MRKCDQQWHGCVDYLLNEIDAQLDISKAEGNNITDVCTSYCYQVYYIRYNVFLCIL